MHSCAFLKVLLLSFYFSSGGIYIFNSSKTAGNVNDVRFPGILPPLKFPVQLYQTRGIGTVQNLCELLKNRKMLSLEAKREV